MKKLFIVVIIIILGMFTVDIFAYEFKTGDYIVMQYDGRQMELTYEKYGNKVGGYKVSRFINKQDYYGGGSYWANVSGVGWAEIGVDIHNALTGEYLGIEVFSSPCPFFGAIEYGAAVGTTAEWKGYQVLEGEDPEDFDRAVWEVVSYEDVSVPYGDFTDAMKVVEKQYFTYGISIDDIQDYQWQLSESCSKYAWLVPKIGVVQQADYEYSGKKGPYPFELVSCKINGKTNSETGNGISGGPGCIIQKLKAAEKLWKSYVKCYAKELKKPGFITACSNKAHDKFMASWDKAEQKAVKKGEYCETSADTLIEDIVSQALDDIYDQISQGLDEGDKNAVKLGSMLLKAAEKRVSSILKAQSKNLKKPDAGKLQQAIAKAEDKFVKSWDKAMAKAIKKGVVYTGPSANDIETMTDALVEDIMDGM